MKCLLRQKKVYLGNKGIVEREEDGVGGKGVAGGRELRQ